MFTAAKIARKQRRLAADKYVRRRRNECIRCIRSWRTQRDDTGSRKRKGEGKKGTESRHEVKRWSRAAGRDEGGVGGRRRSKGVDGGCGWSEANGGSSRAALTWARKSMGPPTPTQTRSVEPCTRPMPIIRSRTRECSVSSTNDRSSDPIEKRLFSYGPFSPLLFPD